MGKQQYEHAFAPNYRLSATMITEYALSLVPAQPNKPVIYALVNKASVTFLLPQGPLEASLEPTP